MHPTIADRITVCNENELCGFLDRLENGHVQGRWDQTGAVVFHIQKQLRWVKSSADVLKHIVPSAEAAKSERSFEVAQQSLKKFPGSQVLHFGSHVSKSSLKEFLNEAAKPENYERDNCCSLLLGEGTEELCAKKIMDHLTCVELPRLAVSVVRDGGHEVSLHMSLEAGAKRRKDFEDNMKRPSEEAVDHYLSSMKPPPKCSDLICTPTTDSEDENEVEEEGIVAARQQAKRMTEQRDAVTYGSSVTYNPLDQRDIRQHLKVTSTFSLSYIFNMLHTLPHHFPGLHTSFLYFGNQMAQFPIHIEDGLLWSANYLYFGAAKIWIVIPPYATEALDYWLSRSGIYLSHTSCRNILGHKNALPLILWLQKHGIPYHIIIQRPGDLVVILPNAPHFGFNCGWNLAEAVNFATKSWLPVGANQRQCACYSTQIHLPIKDLLASFWPDLLRQYLNNEFIKPPYHEQSRKFLYISQAVQPEHSHTNIVSDQMRGNKNDVCTCAISSSATSKTVTLKSGKRLLGAKEEGRLKKKGLYNCVVPKCPWGSNNKLPERAKSSLRYHLERHHKCLMQDSTLSAELKAAVEALFEKL